MEGESSRLNNGGGGTSRRRSKGRYSVKMRRKLGGLNLSGLCRNTSLNSSVMKRTLTSNNRALARALELKKAELGSAQRMLLQARSENQALHDQLRQLRACNGVTVEDFEQEVDKRTEKRVQQRMATVQQGLQDAGAAMLTAVWQISALTDLCSGGALRKSAPHSFASISSALSSATSSCGSNSASTSNSAAPAARKVGQALRGVAISRNNSDDNDDGEYEESHVMPAAPSAVTDPVPCKLPGPAALVAAASNLSIIMEQSFVDSNFDLDDLCPLTVGGLRSSRRNAIVFRPSSPHNSSNDDDTDDITDAADTEPLQVVVGRRVTRSRSRRLTARKSSMEPVCDEDEIEMLEAAEETAPDDTTGDKELQKMENDRALPTEVPSNTVSESPVRDQPVAAVVIDTDRPITGRNNTRNKCDTEVVQEKVAVLGERAANVRNIPSFVPLNDSPPVATATSRAPTMHGKTAASRGGPSSKTVSHSSVNKATRKSPRKLSSDETPKRVATKSGAGGIADSRRMTFVVSCVAAEGSTSKDGEKGSVSSVEHSRKTDSAGKVGSVYFDAGDDDILAESDNVLMDVSGASDNAFYDVTANPPQSSSDSPGQTPMTDVREAPEEVTRRDLPEMEANAVSPGFSVTSLSVIDMELTGNTSEDGRNANKSGDVVSNDDESTLVAAPDSRTSVAFPIAGSCSSVSSEKTLVAEDVRGIVETETGTDSRSKARRGRLTSKKTTKNDDGSVPIEQSRPALVMPIEAAATNTSAKEISTAQNCQETEPSQKSVARKESVSDDNDNGELVGAEKHKKLAVAAYMLKPGKYVFTSSKHLAANEPSVRARSKSKSTLPLQSRPRSKQLPRNVPLPDVDSPSSVFSFEGTPKEDEDDVTARRRTVTKTAIKAAGISMDDSFLPSKARKKSVARASLCSRGTVPRGDGSEESELSNSPHGIMLVLANGKRTKPRMARSKSVRYAGKGPTGRMSEAAAIADETLTPTDSGTPQNMARRNGTETVPLTPGCCDSGDAGGYRHSASFRGADNVSTGVDVVLESPLSAGAITGVRNSIEGGCSGNLRTSAHSGNSPAASASRRHSLTPRRSKDDRSKLGDKCSTSETNDSVVNCLPTAEVVDAATNCQKELTAVVAEGGKSSSGGCVEKFSSTANEKSVGGKSHAGSASSRPEKTGNGKVESVGSRGIASGNFGSSEGLQAAADAKKLVNGEKSSQKEMRSASDVVKPAGEVPGKSTKTGSNHGDLGNATAAEAEKCLVSETTGGHVGAKHQRAAGDDETGKKKERKDKTRTKDVTKGKRKDLPEEKRPPLPPSEKISVEKKTEQKENVRRSGARAVKRKTDRLTELSAAESDDDLFHSPCPKQPSPPHASGLSSRNVGASSSSQKPSGETSEHAVHHEPTSSRVAAHAHRSDADVAHNRTVQQPQHTDGSRRHTHTNCTSNVAGGAKNCDVTVDLSDDETDVSHGGDEAVDRRSAADTRKEKNGRNGKFSLPTEDVLSLRLSTHDEANGGRSRRAAAAAVCYKEPPLGCKLRQGDKFTSTIYKPLNGEQQPTAKDHKKSLKLRTRHILESADNSLELDNTDVDGHE